MNVARVTLARWARGSRRLGPRGLALSAVAWLLLGASALAVALIPFRWVSRLLGEGRTSAPGSAPPSAARLDRARSVAVALGTATRRSPWRSDCYPQALTARALLVAGRVPHVVHFGLRRDEHDALLAHAWVTTGGLVVVGGDPTAFTEVAAFAWNPA